MYKLLLSTVLLFTVSYSTKSVEDQPLTREEQEAQEELIRTGSGKSNCCWGCHKKEYEETTNPK